MNIIDNINQLIDQVMDPKVDLNKTYIIAKRVCQLITEHKLLIVENVALANVSIIFAPEIQYLKQSGNYFVVDEKKDRLLIKSTNPKNKYWYLYYPLLNKWAAANKPTVMYYCESIQKLLDQYINAIRPWDQVTQKSQIETRKP